MKIYTKTGDKGETALFNGTRVPKDHARVAAYGEVDELNALLGLAAARLSSPDLRKEIEGVQRDLFAIGARLADPTDGAAAKRDKTALGDERVTRLETAIDAWEKDLAPLAHFILPGGGEAGATLHLARTVCRRAERSIVSLSRGVNVPPIVITYVNRLSDFLFVMARRANLAEGVPETRW